MCSKLSIKDSNSLHNFVPFNGVTYKHFIRTFCFNRDPYLSEEENLFIGRQVFIEQVSILITFEMYSFPNVADNDYLKIWLAVTEEAIALNKSIKNVSFVINRIKQFVYVQCCKLNLKSIIPAKSYRNNGDFLLTWEYVVFADEKINLYHPLKYPNSPFVVVNTKSKKAMNGIKTYLAEQCPFLTVHATNGYLDDVYKDDLLDCVEILHQRLRVTAPTKQAHTRNVFYKSMSSIEMTRKIHELKSVYLDFLCDIQLPEFTIVYCPENRVNSDNAQADEDAFIFTIYNNHKKIKLIFENTLERRASFVIRCYDRQYQMAVNIVSEYFASEVENKRENIKKLKEKLNRRGMEFYKILHTDFASWRNAIIIL